MRRKAVALVCLWGTAGCAPVTAEVGGGAGDATAEAPADEGLPRPPQGGSEPEADEDGPAQGGSGTADGTDGSDGTDAPEPVRVETGEYTYDFVLEEDPCDWKEFLDRFPDGVADVLPTSFAVEERDEAFDIEAIRFGGNFGTEGPVRCTILDTAFACEPQPVVPVDGFLGSYGWRYEVAFTGEVLSPRRFRGTAVVGFPSIDEATREALASIGLDPSACTQVLTLTLRWDRALDRG